MGKVITQKFISRSDLRNNPTVAYVFGDNRMRRGFGGQAKEMRAEPNAFGIRTKKKPNSSPDSFFTDDELIQNCDEIMADIGRVLDYVEKNVYNGVIVVPEDGLGTGMSDLANKAPKTNEFLQIMTRLMLAHDDEELFRHSKDAIAFAKENNFPPRMIKELGDDN